MTKREELEKLIRQGNAGPDELFVFFDSLEPVKIEGISGSYLGQEVPSGNPLDGLLEEYGWYGKRFAGEDEVDPLLFYDLRGRVFQLDPDRLPLSLLSKKLIRRKPLIRFFRIFIRFFKTDKAKARLRMIEYRGKNSAAMIYDDLPIIDHFRRMDRNEFLGSMDWKDRPPFFFVLRKEKNE